MKRNQHKEPPPLKDISEEVRDFLYPAKVHLFTEPELLTKEIPFTDWKWIDSSYGPYMNSDLSNRDNFPMFPIMDSPQNNGFSWLNSIYLKSRQEVINYGSTKKQKIIG